MLCQNCNKAPATCHYEAIVDGNAVQAHLCTECSKNLGYMQNFISDFPKFTFGLDSLLSNMFKGVPEPAQEKVCPMCGLTAAQLTKTGRVGCAQCYNVFTSLLNPYIKTIHGNASHSGKIASSADASIKAKRKLESLKQQLAQAIQTQEFEHAAQLRDQIRKLEN